MYNKRVYLYCSPLMLCSHFNVIVYMAIKEGGLACHKTSFNPPFFPLEMSCTQSGIWPLLYYSSFSVCYILTLCFRCVVCFLLYLSVNSHYYKTCQFTYLSQIHVFGFDVIFVILIWFCLMLSPFLCVLHFNVVSLFFYI